MKKMSRRLGVLCLVVAGASIAACGSSGEPKSDGTLGQLALPLTTQGPSGVAYRLRHATFVIRSNAYYYGDAAGAGNGDTAVTVNSDDQPDAQSISVSLEQGTYTVQLLPGWSFEKEGPNGPEPIVATLLSSANQWVWISPQSTSWAEYRFGIGDRAIWLNGKLNIDIAVYETPSQYYGGAGDTGVGGGATTAGGAPDF
jgi:hypothetical protein